MLSGLKCKTVLFPLHIFTEDFPYEDIKGKRPPTQHPSNKFVQKALESFSISLGFVGTERCYKLSKFLFCAHHALQLFTQQQPEPGKADDY